MKHAIGTNDIFVDFSYKIFVDAQFSTIDMRGAYAINDGGYHLWVHTLSGSKEGTTATADEERWGGIMESVRKDSERSFGIVKKRFRILHVKSNLHKARYIDTILKVMMLLMLLVLLVVAFCCC